MITTIQRQYIPSLVSAFLLATGLIFDYVSQALFFSGWTRIIWYVLAYLPVGLSVILTGIRLIVKGSVFTEFTLMSVATLGAFAIAEYPEAVAVMLFYTVGELVQGAAVRRSRQRINTLLSSKPDWAVVFRNGYWSQQHPADVQVGEHIEVLSGEKVPLDGTLVSKHATFNTSALTGESFPRTINQGEEVLAGMINLDGPAEMIVTKNYENSSLARMMHMVEHATTRKAQTELFIRKFAKVYTPAVTGLAVLMVLLPAVFTAGYNFESWLYRGLIFLVVSCPCALVISIPLGYFGGIGAGSKSGILFKGGNFLDQIARVNTVAFDKTGTLTQGVYSVREVVPINAGLAELMMITVALERKSNHPAALAIVKFVDARDGGKSVEATGIQELPGLGLLGTVNGRDVLTGNLQLLNRFNISFPEALDAIEETLVVTAVDGKIAGYFVLAEEPRADAATTVRRLDQLGINNIVILSGDRQQNVNRIASLLQIRNGYGDLLPGQKVERLEQLLKTPDAVVAFVGDGINDSPVLALSHVGIAMGAFGSDAAIESADVVIQSDSLSKVPVAIRIGRVTRSVVWQNIGMALGVKILVLLLAAFGIASMWFAVFADVGVALLAVINAVRISRIEF